MNVSINARLVTTTWSHRWLTMPLVMFMALSSVSCGMFGDKKEKIPPYYEAAEVPALSIPEGLDKPSTTTALVIQIPSAPLPDSEPQSLPPRVSSQSTSKNENASIRWGTAGIYLHVDDSQSSVDRRLSYAAKRSGFNYREKPGTKEIIIQYYHQIDNSDEGFFSKMAFWRDDGPNYSGEYLISTEAEGESTRIYIRNPDGSDCSESAAEHLLIKLDERLG